MRTLKNTGTKLITDGGYLSYIIENNEITIDVVCVEIPRQGIATFLINE